eukprot:1461-Amphidinium_carterae.4
MFVTLKSEGSDLDRQSNTAFMPSRALRSMQHLQGGARAWTLLAKHNAALLLKRSQATNSYSMRFSLLTQAESRVPCSRGIRRSRTGGTPSRVAGAPCSWTVAIPSSLGCLLDLARFMEAFSFCARTEARAASPVRQIYANWGTGTGLTGRTSPGPSRQSPTAIASDLFAGLPFTTTQSAVAQSTATHACALVHGTGLLTH